MNEKVEKIVACEDFILIEKDDKLKKNKHSNDSPFLSSVNLLDNLGTIHLSNNENYPKGMKVYFAGSFEKVIIKGCEYLVIKSTNIVAKIVEE